MWNNQCVFTFFSALLYTVYSQQRPLSPCPGTFSYEYDGIQWYGLIQVPSPGLNQNLSLNIEMYMERLLPTDYKGRIELLGERADVLKNILYGYSQKYKVHFPLLDVHPTVGFIEFNGKQICARHRVNEKHLTTIKLNHFLDTVYKNSSKQPQTSYAEFDWDTFVDEYAIQKSTPKGNGNTQGNIPIYNTQNLQENPERIRPTTARVPIKNNNNLNLFHLNKLNKKKRPNPDNFADNPKTSTDFHDQDKIDSKNEDESRCGHYKRNPNTLPEDLVGKGDWPWLAAIFIKIVSGLEFACGGTLISKTLVATSGSCVAQKNNRATKKDELVIKLGAYNLHDWIDDDSIFLKVKYIIFHPDFENNLFTKSDIAVLNIPPVTYTDYVYPICLWPTEYDSKSFVGQYASMVGWRRDSLNESAVPWHSWQFVINNERCGSYGPDFAYLLSDTTFCAVSGGNIGPCNVNPGSGLYISDEGRWRLTGIVSYLVKNDNLNNACKFDETIVYTDVTKYIPWIESNL